MVFIPEAGFFLAIAVRSGPSVVATNIPVYHSYLV